MMTMLIGPTGEYPDGQLSEDDSGEIVIVSYLDERNLVHVEFGAMVKWLAMPAEIARELADRLLSLAEDADAKSAKAETAE